MQSGLVGIEVALRLRLVTGQRDIALELSQP